MLVFFLVILCMIWGYMGLRDKAYISSSQLKVLWLITAFVISLMAFLFVPKAFIDWDLIRLFRHVDNIRSTGLESALQFSEYRNLYVWKYWMYLVSMTPWNGFLQSVPLFLDFLIFGYIIFDLINKAKYRYDTKRIVCSICIWLSMMGLKLAISDIRCVHAMGLCCLALYWEYILKENRIKALCLYIVAIFIHHFTVVFIVLRAVLSVIRKIKHKWIIPVGAIFTQIIIYNGANYVYYNFSNEYFRTMARKLLNDWNIYSFSTYFFQREISMKVLYLVMISIFFIGLVWSIRCKRQAALINVSDNFIRVNDVMFVLCSLGIGFSFNYLLLERLLYIAGYIYAVQYLLRYDNGIKSIQTIIIVPFLLYLFYINDINIFIANALGYYYL